MLRNKKGLDYIDWTLSMGLFLVIVVALFVFLKPGAQPAYEGDNLLVLLEKSLLQEAGSVIKETPLFVKALDDKYAATLEATIDIGLQGSWKFLKISPPAPSTFEPITFQTKRIMLDCKVGTCKENFLISWTQTASNPLDPVLEAKCTPHDDKTVCDAILGSTETLEGLDKSLITNKIQSQNYTQVKTRWRFPRQKEFAIYLDGNPITNGPTPGPQANVFVKELKYWTIKNTIRTPTTISLRVW